MLDSRDIIYMILTDRFCVGYDNEKLINDPEWCANHPEFSKQNLKFYQGGSWEGISRQIPYLEGLGVTAIWISPVSENEVFNKTGNEIIAKYLNDPDYDGSDGGEKWVQATIAAKEELLSNPDVETGFHGYFTKNYDNLNSYFGNLDDLMKLSEYLHNRNMKLMGMMNSLYNNLLPVYQKDIAKKYNTGSVQLSNWIENMRFTRNHLAHCMRIYRYNFGRIPKSCKKNPINAKYNGKIFDQIAIMSIMFSDKSEWNEHVLTEIQTLLNEYKDVVKPSDLGMPDNWYDVLKKG